MARMKAASFCSFSKRYSGKPGPAHFSRNRPLPNFHLKIICIKIIRSKPELPEYNSIRHITQMRCLPMPHPELHLQ